MLFSILLLAFIAFLIFRGIRAWQTKIPAPSNEWNIAVGHCADLSQLDARLAAIDRQLSNRFRATLLENKQFSDRRRIAETIETEHWTQRFGPHPEIISFGKQLADSGHTKEAMELEQAVAVLGSSVDPATVIEPIRQRLSRASPRESAAEIAERLSRTQYVADANLLIEALGGTVLWAYEPGKFNKSLLLTFQGQRHSFKSEYEMTQWVIRNVARPDATPSEIGR